MIGRWDGIIESAVDERTVQRMAAECWVRMGTAMRAREKANAELRNERMRWRYLVRAAEKLGVKIEIPR